MDDNRGQTTSSTLRKTTLWKNNEYNISIRSLFITCNYPSLIIYVGLPWHVPLPSLVKPTLHTHEYVPNMLSKHAEFSGHGLTGTAHSLMFVSHVVPSQPGLHVHEPSVLLQESVFWLTVIHVHVDWQSSP